MIEYSFSKTVHNEHPFDEVTDFLLKVPCQGKADTIDYIYRLYRFGADLYITDIFPKMYEGDSRCFKRFTSHEGYNVNMRSLAVSCLRIFVNEIISANHDAVMVVSGSYADGEDEDGPSRKLKLYWYCFKPLLGELNLRMVDVSGHNAFMLLRGDSGVSDDLLMRQYLAFKSRGIVTCDRELEDNVFVVPTRDVEWPYLVYAPLAGRYLFADSEGLSSIDTIKQALKHSSTQALKQSGIHHIRRAEELQKMAILPNHTCNFSCSYCYSAKGRSGTVLERETLDRALEWFVNSRRLAQRSLSISFIGGGEPLLSWPLVEHGIEYADSLSKQHGMQLSMSLITNGSIMNEHIAECLKRFDVLPDVSFDILEEAQNKNRKHYDLVCRNIDILCDAGIPPSINATVTPDTVEHLEDMVVFMARRFPLVDSMVFEPVVSTELFPSADDLRRFYELYLDHFFAAKTVAGNVGKYLNCRIYKNIDSVLDRGCPSKFALTPQGDISICYCTSSPNERMFSKRVYGRVTGEGVEIDNERFLSVHETDVHSFEKCRHCFAKWHCGGGCMCPNDSYDEPHLDEVCRFTRQLVIRTLIERARKQLSKSRVESRKLR